jgi:hypothetical protein
MKKRMILVAVLLMSLTLSVAPAVAAQMRLFVADVSVVGVQNKDEMKTTLQTLLASRLNGGTVLAVGSAAEADAVVSGSYVSIGKVFSVDALAKTVGGKTLARAFVQGDTQDELIPAIGTLAEKLVAELAKVPVTSEEKLLAELARVPETDQLVRPSASVPKGAATPTGEFIKPQEVSRNDSGGWQSKRFEGAASLMAAGRTRADGSRELFLAEARRIAYYRQGKEMVLIAEAELAEPRKIISLDTLEDGAGALDIYVTVIRAGELSSQIWQVSGDKLVLVADQQPYYFRAFSVAGGPKKLFAQTMGRDDADFFGDVFEATRSGKTITIKTAIKMPRYGNIYTFNQFRTSDGTLLSAVISPDNYLIVYDGNLKELWRSNDKLGGSELYYQRDDSSKMWTTGDQYRWIFMNQRIQVTSKGAVVVGKNEGFFVLGKARTYKTGTVYCFVWNGSTLDEKWHTRVTQNYMPDFHFDEARNELLMLQTVQRPGISERGASSLMIKKVE